MVLSPGMGNDGLEGLLFDDTQDALSQQLSTLERGGAGGANSSSCCNSPCNSPFGLDDTPVVRFAPSVATASFPFTEPTKTTDTDTAAPPCASTPHPYRTSLATFGTFGTFPVEADPHGDHDRNDGSPAAAALPVALRVSNHAPLRGLSKVRRLLLDVPPSRCGADVRLRMECIRCPNSQWYKWL